MIDTEPVDEAANALVHSAMPFATTIGVEMLEGSTNFFRAVTKGRVYATTKPLHVGRKVIVLETDLIDDDGRRVARVTQSQMVLLPQ